MANWTCSNRYYGGEAFSIFSEPRLNPADTRVCLTKKLPYACKSRADTSLHYWTVELESAARASRVEFGRNYNK